MINNFEEPKPTKQKIMNQIVSPIPKKVLSCSNNDNLQMKATNHPNLISNFENSSNLQKFIFHKNSAFRSPNFKATEADENKPNIMNLKIPDFIMETKKEKDEALFKNSSGSEQDINDFWSNQVKTQPVIKDLMLQECFASIHPFQSFQRQLFYDSELEKPKIIPRKNSFNSETLSEKRKIPLMKKTKTCNCKKTKCLKLYCECFSSGEMCGPFCNCTGCFNNTNQVKLRSEAIEIILEKQPEAFMSKYKTSVSKDNLAHKKGCNCRKSYCLKKYCECFAAGIICTDQCKCEECKNNNADLVGNLKKKVKMNDHEEKIMESKVLELI